MSEGIKAVADLLAAQGRNGDTTLVHMSPMEVAALERLSGQRATTNPATGKPEGFAWIPFLIAAAISGGSSIASSKIAANSAEKQAEQAKKLQEEQAEIDRRRAEKYAQDFVNIPAIRNVQSPAPDLNTYTPGVSPERMQITQTVDGYLRPRKTFAEGGAVQGEQQVVADAVAALQGRHPNPEQAFQAFVEMFGMEELEDLEREVLGGGAVNGDGAGMDDKIEALLSDGEYVVPADAVAHLGDGSSKAGGQRLDQMVQQIRKEKTGKTVQPGKIDPRKVMP